MIIWIIISVIGVASLAWLAVAIVKSKPQAGEEIPIEIPDDCCGAHEVCERDSLLSKTDEIVYFDDEELDKLKGKKVESYTPADVDMLEHVFYTLREQDVAGWIRSLQLRDIALPSDLRDEALLIISERRTVK